MEAKDTVMTLEQTQVIVDELIAEESNADRVSLLRTEFEAQAEISFKAGIKEVVGWLEKEHKMYAYREINGGRKEDTYGVFVDDDKWQAKLKEWELE